MSGSFPSPALLLWRRSRSPTPLLVTQDKQRLLTPSVVGPGSLPAPGTTQTSPSHPPLGAGAPHPLGTTKPAPLAALPGHSAPEPDPGWPCGARRSPLLLAVGT